MTSKSHLTRCATFAIAATLALGSTPLLAQEAAAPPVTTAPPPTIIVPDVAPVPAPAPAPAPTVVVPAEVSPPEAVAPAEPAPETPPPAAAARAPVERPAPAAAAPEPVADESAPVAPEPLAEAPVDTAATVEVPQFVSPVEPAPAPELAPTTDETRAVDNTMAIVLGILAALALIVIGFFALRRKGPKRYAAAAPRIERPVPAAAPVRADPLPETRAAPFGVASARPAGGLSHAGAAVALPREMPKSYEEREALMRRMVDAAPDRANPFRSRRARMKRARLILGSLHRDFRDTDPWIDLSQYSSNWPELARRQSVAA